MKYRIKATRTYGLCLFSRNLSRQVAFVTNNNYFHIWICMLKDQIHLISNEFNYILIICLIEIIAHFIYVFMVKYKRSYVLTNIRSLWVFEKHLNANFRRVATDTSKKFTMKDLEHFPMLTSQIINLILNLSIEFNQLNLYWN